MILRSPSDPVTGTFLSSFSTGSPNREFDTKHKLSSHALPNLNLTPFSCCSSSPISQLNQETTSLRLKGFRRAWSDSHLERLVYPSSGEEELHKFPRRHYRTMSTLHSAPSFSIFTVNDGLEDEEKNGGKERTEEEALMRTVTIGDSIEGTGNGVFSFGKKSMRLIEEEGEEEQKESLNEIDNLNLEEVKEPVSPPLYLATGLGIGGIDFGGGRGGGFDLNSPNFDENGDLEEYYKRMVDEFPCHPLFLANYAQLLQSKGDLQGAEEYYHRAALADPDDAEILLKYAKLEWQLHHDQYRALSNFECAVRAAPQNSHVLAAYASFLWEIDDDKDEDALLTKDIQVKEEENLAILDNLVANLDFEPLQLSPSLEIDVVDHATSDSNKGENVEEYYRRMVEENPSNSLVLRNYAQFLYKSKGDLLGAEEYYSRALLAAPGDGEIMSQYAKLVWELHQDHEKALSYFERAVQATPEDSHVLAAYASFLWETEENEDEYAGPDQFQEALHQESTAAAVTA